MGFSTSPPEPCPFAKGQIWRFRDGREGVCSSANTSCAAFYVGPQQFTIPCGDWSAVLVDATRLNDDVRDQRAGTPPLQADPAAVAATDEERAAGLAPKLTRERIRELDAEGAVASAQIGREIAKSRGRRERKGEAKIKVASGP